MRKSKRLGIVEQLAERREEECAKALGICRQKLSNEEQKLVELRAYETEYLARKNQLAKGQGGAAALHNYIGFMHNLSAAITQQHSLVLNLQQQLGLLKKEWAKRHAKKKNLVSLIGRYRQAEELEIEKKLQKEIDDQVNYQKKGKSSEFV